MCGEDEEDFYHFFRIETLWVRYNSYQLSSDKPETELSFIRLTNGHINTQRCVVVHETYMVKHQNRLLATFGPSSLFMH